MNEAIQGLVAGEALYTLFQPIIDGATREPIGYEALTRGPEGPLELPSALIAAAATAGLSIPLERFTVAVEPGSVPGLLEVVDLPSEAKRWRFTNLPVASDYIGVVAHDGPISAVEHYRW